MSAATATVESGDIVRLILQFCKENGLHRTLQTLQEETRVSLNTVDSLDGLTSDINHGRWDSVLQTMSYLSLPDSLLQDLYAHIVLEFIELHENELATHIMRETGPCISMKQDDPNRWRRLEQALKAEYFNPREAYEGGSKEKVRQNLAQQIVKNVQVAPPSRLLALVGQAMKWQQHTGLLPPDAKMDVFRGVAVNVEEEAEQCPQVIAKTIKFGKKSHPEIAAFSPDGQFMVSGSVDGFIECWDYHSGTLRKDLQYQDEGNFMMHDKAVIAAAFSKDSDLLATGSQDGCIKVWRIISGECVKKIERAHGEGITDLSWSKDSTTLLSASFDHTARVQGLKSGKTLKEFRGHTSYVNGALFTRDNSKVITWSSDSKVKVFDAKTTECLKDITPPPPAHVSSEMQYSVNCCVLAPREGSAKEEEAQFFVCCRHNTIHLMNTAGQVLRSFSSGKKSSGDFVTMTISPKGNWLYAVGEDHTLYSFSSSTGKLEQMMLVAEQDVIGVIHHPNRNIVCAYSADGKLAILKP